ncbi:MAG: nucleotidyltransferase domain-containing protein [Chloroflexi bacterium]|nr:nucleotidyltransferase domain-containing protein [Chloroflexota bacterium]
MIAPLELAQQVASRLGEIEGIQAVVLGGSHARGDAKPNSDIDLGIYYDPTNPPALASLRALAAELDDQHRSEAVTNFGEWGPWINGGAWLDIQGQRVDWLYCNLTQVEFEISECEAGRPKVHYQPGHPHGFWNHIYLGQVFYCRPLFERAGELTALKKRAESYPALLKKALIGGLWEAGFSLENAYKPATRGDAFIVAGHVFRSAATMVQALFALNERYCINEKGAVDLIETMPLHPPDFAKTVHGILGNLGKTPDELEGSVAQLGKLLEAVQILCQ